MPGQRSGCILADAGLGQGQQGLARVSIVSDRPPQWDKLWYMRSTSSVI